jgi:uncharacterized protein
VTDEAVRIEFEWDRAKAARNFAKHSVSFQLAMTVFADPSALTIYDEDHSDDEDRWITIGLASDGNLIVVVHTHQQHTRDRVTIRIISARRPTARETRDYLDEGKR